MTWLWVLVAGGLGAVARYEVIGAVQRLVKDPRPWGTFVVNVTGAALGGLAAGAVAAGTLTASQASIAATGFIGGYSTFSTWMVETLFLAEGGGPAGLKAGIWNLVGTLVVGLAAAWVGLAIR